jgi:hypothetical protein
MPDTLFDLDAAVPGWQNTTGIPSAVTLAGWNLLALYSVPQVASTALTLDVVQNAPIPAADGDFVQMGSDQLDALLDYAEHLALFKCGGSEFAATLQQADNFLLSAMQYNQRLSATARYIVTPKQYGTREKLYVPREQNAESLGTGASQTEAQSFVKQRVPARLN